MALPGLPQRSTGRASGTRSSTGRTSGIRREPVSFRFQRSQENSSPVIDFRVDLNVFRGPLDLLLYLVRKHEVEIVDIPIAAITDQYLEYLAVLEQLDVNAVGDFLAMASLLIEIKSQQVLPRSDEVEDEMDDPRQELVRRLLEYKKYRDAASMLEERSRSWQQHYPRLSTDLPPARARPGRASRSRRSSCGTWSARSAGSSARPRPPSRRASSTTTRRSTSTWAASTPGCWSAGRLAFRDLFEPSMHKSTLVGIFLAILELVRHHHVRVEQNALFGEIWILPNLECTAPLDLSDVDEYEHASELVVEWTVAVE